MANRAVLGMVVGLSALVFATTSGAAIPQDSWSRLYGASLSVTVPGSAAEKVEVKEISGGKLQREAGGTFSMEDVVVKVLVTADGTPPAAGAKATREAAFANRFRTDLSARTVSVAFEPLKAPPKPGPNVVFKIAADPAVREWFRKGGARNISVSLLGSTGNVLRDYQLGGCEPVSLTVPMSAASGGGTVEVDTLTVKSTSLQIKSNAALARWLNAGGRASTAVTLLNRDGSNMKTYSFLDATLTKFEVAPFDGNVPDVQAIESYSFKVDRPSPFF